MTFARIVDYIAFDHVEKRLNVKWLSDIGIAAAREDFRLVARHSKSGHRNNRDGARLRVNLEPTRRFGTGNIGQLDVQQDDVRRVFPGEFEGRRSLTGGDYVITAKFKKII